MKQLLTSILFALVVIAVPQAAFAETTCTPIYGGGQSCVQVGNIRIDKKVAHPQTGALVDNLGVNDAKFAPDQAVTFDIRVTNVGDTTIQRITVRDIFPQFVDFVAGPGNFDAGSKVLTFEVINLGKGESRNFTVTGKVKPLNQLPADAVTCVVNQATASPNGETSRDNAQFCIERQAQVPAQPGKGEQVPPTTKGGLKVFPQPTVTTTPPTGPEMLPLIGLIPTGLAGFFLRKKAGK